MMRQHWTLMRRQVSHPAAERRWDEAYQQLLAVLNPGPGVPGTNPPTATPEGGRHARSHLRPSIDPAPNGDADD